MTKSVLWDLDGTLVDSEQYHWLAWRDTMAAEGVALTHEEFLKTFGLRNDAIVPQWIPGATPERIDQIARAKEQLYRRLVREGGLDPLPGARHWTERLARDGWRQAIASSAPRENVDVCSPSSASRPASRPSFPPKMSRSASPTRRYSSPPPRAWALPPRSPSSSKTRPPGSKPRAAPEWPASESAAMARPSPPTWPFPPSPTSLPTPSPAW